MLKRESIQNIFTPRKSSVNENMYVDRPILEKKLLRSIYGTLHTFLFGESGNGKSWLYKEVFHRENINAIIVNCAKASINNSIIDELYDCVTEENHLTKVTRVETGKSGLNAGIKAESISQDNYNVKLPDKLLISFKEIKKKSKCDYNVIVFDNMERLLNNKDLLDELSNMIILLDDDKYAKYNIKFLLVGLPNEVLQFFTMATSSSSVSNRIEEIPKVAGLNRAQIIQFIDNGFRELLKVDISDTAIKQLAQHIENITLGIPQRMHEYCRCLAYRIEDNNYQYEIELLPTADEDWLQEGLRESYSTVEQYLDTDDKTAHKKNQIIYCIGKISAHEINVAKISAILTSEFKKSVIDETFGISDILESLSIGTKPLIQKIVDSSYYTISDPRYLMCIKLMVRKNYETEDIFKKAFKIN